MGTILKIGGPYTSIISDYMDMNISGIETIDLGNDYGKWQEENLGMNVGDYLDMGDPINNRSLLGGDFNIVWSLEVEEFEGGIKSLYPTVNRVYGRIEIQDSPIGQDPSNNDIELEEFDVEFDTDVNKGFELQSINSRDIRLDNGISTVEINIDLNKKVIGVEFG